jgi:hypothetical protein|tara:strand:- start:253 stop:546 length:294 start_codon:yes stop_codon:yes gene_type:complete
MKLKINGLMNDDLIAWKKIPCSCDMSNPEKCHPISRNCKHCCCKQAEDSMPRESFKINRPELDKNGKPTEKLIVKEVKEITISRSTDGYNSILGWSF